jgi:hypothetical protein
MVRRLTGNEANAFTAGLLSVTRMVESYQPRDAGQYQHTIDLIQRGSLREAMVTDDLPILLAAGTDLRVRQAYQEVSEADWRRCFAVDSLPNFREHRIAMMTDMFIDDQTGNTTPNGRVPLVPEGHGYDDARISEQYEKMKLDTYGATFTLTRQMLINDDTRSLRVIPTEMGRAMARTLNWQVANVLEQDATALGSGYVLVDGEQLFCDAHNNFQDAVTSLTIENLIQEYAAFVRQATTPAGFPMRLRPVWLIVPPELEITADRCLNQSAAQLIATNMDGTATTQAPNWNWIAGRLQVIVLDDLTNPNDWYLACANTQHPTVEVAFLNGDQQPDLFSQDASVMDLHSSDGMQYKIRHDWGAYAADYRGLRKVNATTYA